MTAEKKRRKPAAGVLLLAHGSSEPGVETEAESLCRKLARVGGAGGFYALAWLNRKPDLVEGVASLVKRGCRHVQIMPLLVFRGKHLKKDVPVMMSEAGRLHPEVRLSLGTPITGIPGFARWFARESATPLRRFR